MIMIMCASRCSRSYARNLRDTSRDSMTIQSQKLEVRAKFDSQQKHWEDMYHQSDYGSRGHQWRQESGIVLLRRFLPNGGRILDVGCGCGHASTALAQFGYQVIGLDISENMIRQARRNAQSMGLGENCAFRAGDFEKEWLTLEPFDGILALGFIEYFDDPVWVLRSFLIFSSQAASPRCRFGIRVHFPTSCLNRFSNSAVRSIQFGSPGVLCARPCRKASSEWSAAQDSPPPLPSKTLFIAAIRTGNCSGSQPRRALNLSDVQGRGIFPIGISRPRVQATP